MEDLILTARASANLFLQCRSVCYPYKASFSALIQSWQTYFKYFHFFFYVPSYTKQKSEEKKERTHLEGCIHSQKFQRQMKRKVAESEPKGIIFVLFFIYYISAQHSIQFKSWTWKAQSCKKGGTTVARGRGGGGSQLRRRERKPGTLYTLWECHNKNIFWRS